uniref:Uncharacterized protein n=1 Tax=Anguilla anguilla TaxID=7936 RepID=A0A0E9PYB8_ANGAN
MQLLDFTRYPYMDKILKAIRTHCILTVCFALRSSSNFH